MRQAIDEQGDQDRRTAVRGWTSVGTFTGFANDAALRNAIPASLRHARVVLEITNGRRALQDEPFYLSVGPCTARQTLSEGEFWFELRVDEERAGLRGYHVRQDEVFMFEEHASGEHASVDEEDSFDCYRAI